MYNNTNNPNRRNNNNNQRRNNSRNGSKPNNNRGGQNRPPRNFDDENISPQQKRHFVNKRDTHLSRGKELRAAGDRVEAENEFQHAEHYTRMIKIADDQQQKFLDRKAAERPPQQENPQGEGNADGQNGNIAETGHHDSNTGVVNYAELRTADDRDELMVSEGGPVSEEAPLANESKPRNQRRPKRPAPVKDFTNPEATSAPQAQAEPAQEIAELPFMQPITLAAEDK